MTFFNLSKRLVSFILIITLLAGLALAVTGCEDFDFGSPQEPVEEPKEEEEETLPVTTITTEDRAILAVHEYLLAQAKSYQAKLYLADFYAAIDEWSADLELFKDGTSVWYVVGGIRAATEGEERPHWQRAGWLVFRDSKVMPSNRLQANALRIEVDLQELNLQPES